MSNYLLPEEEVYKSPRSMKETINILKYATNII